jgi:hypothetical protein
MMRIIEGATHIYVKQLKTWLGLTLKQGFYTTL